MYSEDVDLCFKVRRGGYDTYYVPAAEVVHHGGGSGGGSQGNTFSNVMMLESRWKYFRKTRSRWYGGLYRFTMFLASLMRISIILLTWPAGRWKPGGSAFQETLKKWRAKLRWTLGFEKWVKDY